MMVSRRDVEWAEVVRAVVSTFDRCLPGTLRTLP
jgi:hypothetical protein